MYQAFNGNGKILWSGSYYMTENQTATFSEKVSEQPSGIVIVFSGMLMELPRTTESTASLYRRCL